MPTPGTLLVILAATLTAAAGSLWCAARFRQLRHRHPDEISKPEPRYGRWIPVAATVSTALVAARLGTDGWPWLIPLVAFLIVGAWLAAIDLDVHRLPNRITAPLAAIMITGTTTAAIILGIPTALLSGLLCAALTLGTLLLLDRFQPGGMGDGDIKLACLLSFTLGSIGLGIAWAALILACFTSLIQGLIRRRGSIPFGPGLYTGTVLAIVLFA